MSIRVLIVEDNAVARSFLTRVVRESFSDEIRFSEASDLDSARQWLGIGPGEQAHAPADGFRLILCDLEQPDKAGLELLAQLADYPAIKIATTLHSDDEHLFPALLCGANGYLLKEDRFEVLVEELQRQGRAFLKPLRFDAKSGACFPNALLLDAGPTPFPLHVLSAFMDPRERAAKEKAIAGAGVDAWVWSTDQPMPALRSVADFR